MSETQEPCALFLDRDGVINVDSGYIWRPEDFLFNEGVFEACRTAQARWVSCAVRGHQSGLASGGDCIRREDFQGADRVDAGVGSARKSIEIGRVYFAPTHPEEWHRRLPPGIARPQAGSGHASSRRVTPSISICRAPRSSGDRETDILAGINGGVATRILVEGAEDDPAASQCGHGRGVTGRGGCLAGGARKRLVRAAGQAPVDHLHPVLTVEQLAIDHIWTARSRHCRPALRRCSR